MTENCILFQIDPVTGVIGDTKSMSSSEGANDHSYNESVGGLVRVFQYFLSVLELKILRSK